jgi:putative FmdB family regulatory protein
MPIYEYECAKDGVFELERSMDDRAKEAPCPLCQGASSRIISLPSLTRMARSEVRARDRNEKNQHEPRVVGADAAHARAKAPALLESAPHTGRPWALGH